MLRKKSDWSCIDGEKSNRGRGVEREAMDRVDGAFPHGDRIVDVVGTRQELVDQPSRGREEGRPPRL
jgi:hypothetical protein